MIFFGPWRLRERFGSLPGSLLEPIWRSRGPWSPPEANELRVELSSLDAARVETQLHRLVSAMEGPKDLPGEPDEPDVSPVGHDFTVIACFRCDPLDPPSDPPDLRPFSAKLHLLTHMFITF